MTFRALLPALAILLLATAPSLAQQVDDNLVQPAPAAAPSQADLARREALVSRYVTPERYGNLYDLVLDQYAAMSPNNAATAAMKSDPVFRSQIFNLVQQRAANSFTMPELQAMQGFVETKEGASITKKVDALGLQFRQKDLDDNERVALRNFSQTPEGKSIAGKGTAFAGHALSDVMRTVLIRQAMNGSLKQ